MDPSIISEKLRKQLRKKGAILVSDEYCVFPASVKVDFAEIEDLGFTYDRGLSGYGRQWFKYEP